MHTQAFSALRKALRSHNNVRHPLTLRQTNINTRKRIIVWTNKTLQNDMLYGVNSLHWSEIQSQYQLKIIYRESKEKNISKKIEEKNKFIQKK